MRHWSLIRMLCCPARLPASASSRFPGGTRRDIKSDAASIIHSFLKAVRWMSWGSFRTTSRRKIFSASGLLNDLIMNGT